MNNDGIGYGRKQLFCNLDTIPSLPSRAEKIMKFPVTLVDVRTKI